MKYLIKIILMVVFVGVTLFAKDVATVTGLNGGAFIQRAGEKIKVSLGVKLQENDTIITDDKAKVQIIFKDETIVTLGKNSNFAISEYLFEDNQKPVVKFSMLRGAMRTITGQIGKVAPDKFSVVTKTATIGIRGTNFTVLVNNDGSHNVFCTFGAISVGINGAKYIVNQSFYLHLSVDGKVKVKEFSPQELKMMREKSFGKSDKKGKKDNLSLNIEGQIDETTDDDGDIVIKDITDQVENSSNTPILTYDASGYGESAKSDDKLYLMNLKLKYKPEEETAMLKSGSIRYEDGSEDRTYTIFPTTSFSQDLSTYFSDIEYDDSDKVVSNIENNYFISMDNAIDSDYIGWGEWVVQYDLTYDGTTNTINENGLWVAGNPTDTAVVDGISGEFSYTGSYKAYDFDSNGDLIDGDASLEVDFGNDKAALTIHYGGDDIKFDNNDNGMDISGNSFAGDQNNANNGNGSATGRFYGPNADVVGGEFVISDSDNGVHAKGVYQVGNKTQSSGGQ